MLPALTESERVQALGCNILTDAQIQKKNANHTEYKHGDSLLALRTGHDRLNGGVGNNTFNVLVG